MRKGKGKGTDERWVRTILQKPEAVSSIALNLCSKVLAYHIDLVGEEWIQCLQQKPESQNVPQTDYFTEQKEGKVLHPQPMRPKFRETPPTMWLRSSQQSTQPSAEGPLEVESSPPDVAGMAPHLICNTAAPHYSPPSTRIWVRVGWSSGSALYLISNSHWFSSPSFPTSSSDCWHQGAGPENHSHIICALHPPSSPRGADKPWIAWGLRMRISTWVSQKLCR